MSARLLIGLLSQRKVISFRREFATIAGSADGGLYLSQLAYWQEIVWESGKETFYKTAEEIFDETMIRKDRQRTLRKKLEEQGVITTTLKGIPPKMWFQVNAEVIAKLLNLQLTRIPTNKNEDSNKYQEESQQIYTETTTENTNKRKTNIVKFAEIEQIFGDYKLILNHPRAKLDEKRKKVVHTALKLGYTRDVLSRAFVGCKRSFLHMGYNKQAKTHDSLELILRSADNIERFAKYADEPPKPWWSKTEQPAYEIMRQAQMFYERVCAEAKADQSVNNNVIDNDSGQIIQMGLSYEQGDR